MICEFCRWNLSSFTVIIDGCDGRQYNRERYKICTQCRENLRDDTFLQTIRENKCERCNSRYGAVVLRYRDIENEPIINMRVCQRCFPTARDTVNHFVGIRDSPRTVTNVWDGRIEFKDNNCFIWDPMNITIRRNRGTGNSFVELIIDGIDRDYHSFLHAHNSINRAFIYDRDIILILHGAKLQGVRDAYAGIFGPFDIPSRRVELNFLCTKLETRAVEAERARSALANRRITGITVPILDEGRDMLHHQLYTTSNDRIGIVLDENDGIWQPRQYDDVDDRILCWCSCGWEKKVPASQHTVTHDEIRVTITDALYRPGSWTKHVFTGHTVTLQSSSHSDILR